jgi:Tol biopolymer transport system component
MRRAACLIIMAFLASAITLSGCSLMGSPSRPAATPVTLTLAPSSHEAGLSLAFTASRYVASIYPLAPERRAREVLEYFAWSPDGQWLAFVQRDEGKHTGRLGLLNVESGRLLHMGEGAMGGSSQALDWIDNEHVAYLCASGAGSGSDLVVQAVSGGKARVIMPNADFFSLSPDRTRIACYANWTLAVVDRAHGSDHEVLTTFRCENIYWSPSGDRLLGYGSESGLYVGAVASGAPLQRIETFGTIWGSQPWSPDGRRFVLVAGDEGTKESRLAIFDTRTQASTGLGVDVGGPWEAAWSPAPLVEH